MEHRRRRGRQSFSNNFAADDLSATAGIDNQLFSTSSNLRAGSYTQTVAAISGTDAANYSFTPFTTGSATYVVNPLAISVTGLSASNKIYDETTAAALTGTASIRVLYDDLVTLGGIAAGSFSNMNAGNNIPVTVTGNTISGTDATNYSLFQQSGLMADIIPQVIIISDFTQIAAAAGYVGETNFKEIVANVNLNLSVTDLFSDTNLDSGKMLTLSNTDSVADKSYYIITDQTDSSMDLTPNSLLLSTWMDSFKSYDRISTATAINSKALSNDWIRDDYLYISAIREFRYTEVSNAKFVTLASAYDGNYNITGKENSIDDITEVYKKPLKLNLLFSPSPE